MVDTSTVGRVEIVKSDGGFEFRGRYIDVCIDNIKREYAAGDSPRRSGSIERAFSIVDGTRQDARIQAEKVFRDPKAFSFSSLWSEATRYAVDYVNRAATQSNAD